MKNELELGLFGYQKWGADEPDWLEISKNVCTVDQLQKAPPFFVKKIMLLDFNIK